MTLQAFINFARMAFTAFLELSNILNTPIRTALRNMSIGGTGLLNGIIRTLDFLGVTWVGNQSVFAILFSSATLSFIIFIGFIRWILDTLP